MLKFTKVHKVELIKSNGSLTKVVRKGTYVRNEFMGVVNDELNQVWKEAKEKSNEKVNWNFLK